MNLWLPCRARVPVAPLPAVLAALLCADCGAPAPAGRSVLNTNALRAYVERFNANDEELYVQHVPNAEALGFLEANIPLFECPDRQVEETYYFRWWTFRKHVKETADGFVITEFLPSVSWAGKENTISCPAGHHFYEGRWLRDDRLLNDYSVFWFRKGASPRSYSFWAADAYWARYLVTLDREWLIDLLPDLVENYKGWEASRLDKNGLFWQIDDRDGMEVSVGGSGYRATINSYMYGDAVAIAKIAELAGKKELAEEYRSKAARIRQLVLSKLWNDGAQFFQTRKREGEAQVDVRELHGYAPWYFNLPEARHAVAWKQLTDPKGFHAPFGPTTAEQRHPDFKVSYQGHACQWNGPSWPFATAQTLTAAANLLNNYQQDALSVRDYFTALKSYASSHYRKKEDGTVVSWIDENLNPFTGEWLARTILAADPKGQQYKERGKDYNHSTYCDLVISGLVGLRPQPDDVVVVNPLVPAGEWDWFCLDRVKYHNRLLTILWDKTGKKYGRGAGLRVLADGTEIAHSDELGRISGRLP
ncbi:MAG: hypothetical protein KIT09_05110 [Bryobacteraceae bacterium]|nr:hypothetical protein [Bryobacteraceae bacterium]